MTFEDRLEIGFGFRQFISLNNIKLPLRIKSRRKLFIRWYMERYSNKTFDKLLNELAYDILYIEIKTLEGIIFNGK